MVLVPVIWLEYALFSSESSTSRLKPAFDKIDRSGASVRLTNGAGEGVEGEEEEDEEEEEREEEKEEEEDEEKEEEEEAVCPFSGSFSS